jgi:hypothetical protein
LTDWADAFNAERTRVEYGIGREKVVNSLGDQFLFHTF